jgi:hypothetical protein
MSVAEACFVVFAIGFAALISVAIFEVFRAVPVCHDTVVADGGSCHRDAKLTVEGYVAVCRCIK